MRGCPRRRDKAGRENHGLDIFNMAMIYKAKGDEETADQLFGQVIMNFADSPLAESARAERGY